jgi:hypothetical protein
MSDKKTVSVVFVLSAARSGSTWLATVLGSNSWAASVGEWFRAFSLPGHVACRMCEADGLAECTKLHGFEKIAAGDAYHFASKRLGKSVLIDSSKRLDWCGQFINQGDLDTRLIHLVRNPCGFVESAGRRQPEFSPDQLLEQWEHKNREIERFILSSGSKHLSASYDDLADSPDTHFPRLCNFIGFEWEPEAINYWLGAHHGLAGNGASSLYLRNRQNVTFQTGDDEFYADLTSKRTTADRRWKVRLTPEFHARAFGMDYAQHLQRQLNTNWFRLLSV